MEVFTFNIQDFKEHIPLRLKNHIAKCEEIFQLLALGAQPRGCGFRNTPPCMLSLTFLLGSIKRRTPSGRSSGQEELLNKAGRTDIQAHRVPCAGLPPSSYFWAPLVWAGHSSQNHSCAQIVLLLVSREAHLLFQMLVSSQGEG